MAQTAIFSPFFAMILLTFIVWVYMYIRRIRFITRRQLTPEELQPIAFAQLSPPSVYNPSDNLKNLFEIPIIFYGIALYLFVTKQVDTVYMMAAWSFVLGRVMHSAVHCTINLVMLRFYLYLFSTIAIWFMATRAALMHFSYS
jgi:hypothetical protein